MNKKTLKYLVVATLIFIISVALFDSFIIKNNNGHSLSYGVAVIFLILTPLAIVGSILYALVKIIQQLSSSKVTSGDKKDMLHRMVIVAIVATAGVFLFALLNAIGTRFIDL